MSERRAVFDFGIEGYRPDWLVGGRAIEETHGRRLLGLVGRRLSRLWVVWDLGDDEWFADCPVLLDFEGQQLELNHKKFDELSVTWNQCDPRRPVVWPDFDLRWRDDALPEPGTLLGRSLERVEFVQWVGPDGSAGEGVDVAFGFEGGGRLTVHNALDENGLALGPPDPRTRVHVLR
ncbi:hypothetical protein ABZO31_32555 [Streptomyces sp. HUAS MG47]|uniref:hypothetical protein n=1 Tax=Streptomyces solicamelliae TaxID=3231716 RepID=UPI003877FB9D